VGPRGGLDRCGKSRPPPGFDPRTVHPVASRYADYATRPTYRKRGLSKSHTWLVAHPFPLLKILLRSDGRKRGLLQKCTEARVPNLILSGRRI
jgi:hypothetical protein